jgi:hypothetical protein
MSLPADRRLLVHLALRLGFVSAVAALLTGLYLRAPGPITGALAAGVGIFVGGLFAIELERHSV